MVTQSNALARRATLTPAQKQRRYRARQAAKRWGFDLLEVLACHPIELDVELARALAAHQVLRLAHSPEPHIREIIAGLDFLGLRPDGSVGDQSAALVEAIRNVQALIDEEDTHE